MLDKTIHTTMDLLYQQYNIDINKSFGYDLDNWSGITDSEKLTNALFEIGNNKFNLIISRKIELTSTVVIPENIEITIKNSAIIMVTSPSILTINGNINAGIVQIFSCVAGNVKLTNCKSMAFPQWFGAKANKITNDQVAIDGIIYSEAPCIRFPKGVYQAYLANGFSNRTFIFDEGSVIDGVVHLAVGSGPGVSPFPQNVTYVENIRVMGCLSCTVRVGSYYCKNVFVDKIHLLANDSSYVNQTAEGGQKGNHFTSGTENLNITEQIIDGTGSSQTYALGIDIYPSDTVNIPKNYKFGRVIINDCLCSGIAISKIKGLDIGELIINKYSKTSNIITDCTDIKIGRYYSKGVYSDSLSIYNLYANAVTNLNIDKCVVEYSPFIGIYILGCVNTKINDLVSNNNKNRGVYVYNDTNTYFGSVSSHDNGEAGIWVKSSITSLLISVYNNIAGNGIIIDSNANGGNNCNIGKIISYNNKDVNIGIYGNNNTIGEILTYSATGAGYGLSLLNCVNSKIDKIESYSCAQGVRLNGITNLFSNFIYSRNNTNGFVFSGANAGAYIDYVKFLSNTTDQNGGTIQAISGWNGSLITT